MAYKTTGVIKRLVADRGFGFIKDEQGGEWFFHRSALTDKRDFDELREGDRVEFEKGQGPKGPRAEDVERV